MSVELHRLQRRILANPRMEQQQRLRVAESYIFPKGLFQSSTWPALADKDFRKPHHAVVNVYRSILGDKAQACRGGMSDDDVVHELHAFAPAVMLKTARLLLLIRVVEKASIRMIALLLASRTSSSSWIASVEKDLAWLTTGTIF